MNSRDHRYHNNHPRPVWLCPQQECRLALEERALLIERAGKPSRPIPLSRISRLYLNEKVWLHSSVLLACASRGIVVQVQQAGHSALMLGQASGRTGLRQRLADLQERPDWQQRLNDWFRYQRRRVESTLNYRLAIAGSQQAYLHGAALRQWINRTARWLVGEENHLLSKRVFHQLAQSVAMQALQQHGLGPAQEQLFTYRAELHRRCGAMLALRLETARLGWLKACALEARPKPVAPLEEQAAIRQVENHRAQAERLAQDLFNRMHRWLVELQQELP